MGININGLVPNSDTRVTEEISQASPAAAAARTNPCGDVEPVSPPPPPSGPSDGGVRDSGSGTTNQPDSVDDAPARDPRPFPQPFRIQDSDEQAQNQELQNDAEQAPNRRMFATATREVTVIPNTIFLSSDTNIPEVYRVLTRDSNPNKSQVNHGKVWFTGRPKEQFEQSDPFRWSLRAFWASLYDREGFVNKATSGHENIFAEPNQDLRLNYGYSTLGSDVIKLHKKRMKAKPGPFQQNTDEGRAYKLYSNQSGVWTEDIRFILNNDISKEIIGKRSGREQFLETYAPGAFINSDLPIDERMNMFISMYLYGERDIANWKKATGLDGFSQAAKDYFRVGILKAQTPGPEEVFYKDYVFDAPVAFFEEELNGMLMAPFHSAKITKNVGNVDFVNLKGYDSELKVPNIYYYYNSIELKKDYEQALLNPQSRVEEDALTNLGITQILSAYQTNKKEEVYKTRDVLKFPSDRVEKFEGINEFMKSYAENYVEVKINTTQGGHINSLLQRNKMDRILMETLYPDETSGSLNISNFSTMFDTQVSMVLDDSFKSSDIEQNSIESTLNDRTVSNIPITIKDGFYNILKEHLPNSSNNDFQKVDKAQYPLFYTGWNNVPMLRLEETIRSQIFCKELEEFIAKGKLQRTYADLLSGERAYAEVVGFKVEKHEVLEDGGEELVQTFILMDSNEIDTIRFLDSQVIPFKKYRYKILSINLVLGTEYMYDSATKVSSPYIDLKVHSKLGVYLIEAPFFEQVVEIRDMPPMSPQVTFLPTQGVDDSLEILLTTNYGESREPWYDPMADKQLLKTKYGMDRDGLITFKTDSLPSSFSIHRLEDAPESYADFEDEARQDYYYKRIPAVSNAGISLEDIEPNKYYYYTFRAYDNWDIGESFNDKVMGSNPTEVFKVRMVSYANGIFLEMDPYEMKKEVRTDNIVFERLLKINPNFDQTTVDYSNTFERLKSTVRIPSNSVEAARQAQGLMTQEQYIAGHHEFQKSAPNPEELKLGTAETNQDSIWSRKFKIRIRSKDSGKMIDLNVKFVQNVDDLKKEE